MQHDFFARELRRGFLSLQAKIALESLVGSSHNRQLDLESIFGLEVLLFSEALLTRWCLQLSPEPALPSDAMASAKPERLAGG